jgi:hypothetical protein
LFKAKLPQYIKEKLSIRQGEGESQMILPKDLMSQNNIYVI